MKKFTSLFLPVIAFTLSLAWTPQAAARDIAVAGSLETTEEVEIAFPVLTAKVFGIGQAHHFGRYTLFIDVTVDMINNTSVGTFSIEVANGDRLIGTVAGLGATSLAPNLHRLVEELTIISGTGRFQGASGKITIIRLANSDTLRSSGTIKGALTLPDNRGHHQ